MKTQQQFTMKKGREAMAVLWGSKSKDNGATELLYTVAMCLAFVQCGLNLDSVRLRYVFILPVAIVLLLAAIYFSHRASVNGRPRK